MDPAETRRRVKAARALAGIGVAELANRIGQRGLGERTLRELEGDSGRPFRPMELQAIADACELPYEFFTVDFARLPELAAASPAADSIEARLARIEGLFDAIARDGGYDDFRALVDSGRRITQGLKDRLPDDEAATPAPAGTRDEGDASEESARAPGAATPRSGRATGG